MGRQQWIVLLLLGLLLSVIALPVSDKKDGNTSGSSEGSSRNLLTEEETESTDLEAKLEALLSGTEGVGKVKVLLMTEDTSQGLYSQGGTEITGVLIAAEGADNSVTVREIQQAVMALFQIEAHKIKIMKMK